MFQYDVCRNPNPSSRKRAPYLLILQSDLLDPIPTVVVAPLVRLGEFEPIRRLNPAIDITDESFVLSTTELAGIPRTAIGPVVSNLAGERDAIIAALDLLFTGI